jgi:hypothetical protein
MLPHRVGKRTDPNDLFHGQQIMQVRSCPQSLQGGPHFNLQARPSKQSIMELLHQLVIWRLRTTGGDS